MNFKLVQEAIQRGWSTTETDFDNIIFDQDFLDWTSIESYDNDDILEVYEEVSKEEFIAWLKQHKSKAEIVNLFADYHDWEVTYKMVENERSIYESDISDLPNDLLDAYLCQIGDECDSDRKWKKVFEKYRLGIDDYIKKIIEYNMDYDLESSEIKEFFDKNSTSFTAQELQSPGMLKVFDEYPQTDVGVLYSKTYDDKLLCFESMMDSVDWDEDILKLYVDKSEGIYEDSLDDNMMSAQFRSSEKEYKQEDRQNNRISYEDAKAYINDNDFAADIQVNDGTIGLEDMSFDHLYINGELQGKTFSMNVMGCSQTKPWIQNREFGDKSMSKNWFYETVDKYII